ncbi:YjbQ family protein [Amycolatopsis speibonae]|uniref:YjbQ family protein n=1 Tax=Amycolatopsis speibonae TaxID=1450224 RepID=A0ABV7P3W3_9PSEU
MTLTSSTRIALAFCEVLPQGALIAVSAPCTVTVDDPEDKVDLTGELRSLVDGAEVGEGTLQVDCGGTSCGLVINENETGRCTDLRRVLADLATGTRDRYHAHGQLPHPRLDRYSAGVERSDRGRPPVSESAAVDHAPRIRRLSHPRIARHG